MKYNLPIEFPWIGPDADLGTFVDGIDIGLVEVDKSPWTVSAVGLIDGPFLHTKWVNYMTMNQININEKNCSLVTNIL